MVKIATAIIKLIHQFIVYQIQVICKMLLIIYVNSHKINALINNDTSQNDKINNGKLSIFRIGFIVVFIIQSIIPHTIKDFHASIEFTEQSAHQSVIPLEIHSFEFSHNNITIIYRINAFKIIDNSIFINIIII